MTKKGEVIQKGEGYTIFGDVIAIIMNSGCQMFLPDSNSSKTDSVFIIMLMTYLGLTCNYRECITCCCNVTVQNG